MKEVGNAEKREVGRWANNRVENSHLPFRQRERAMARFRRLRTLQKFPAVHASFHNHFNQDRHLTDRERFKHRRSAALAEWRTLLTRLARRLRRPPARTPAALSCSANCSNELLDPSARLTDYTVMRL